MSNVIIKEEVYEKSPASYNNMRVGQIFARKGTDEQVNRLRELIKEVGGVSLRFDGVYNKDNDTTRVIELSFKTGDRIAGIAETKKEGARAPIAWCSVNQN